MIRNPPVPVFDGCSSSTCRRVLRDNSPALHIPPREIVFIVRCSDTRHRRTLRQPNRAARTPLRYLLPHPPLIIPYIATESSGVCRTLTTGKTRKLGFIRRLHQPCAQHLQPCLCVHLWHLALGGEAALSTAGPLATSPGRVVQHRARPATRHTRRCWRLATACVRTSSNSWTPQRRASRRGTWRT